MDFGYKLSTEDQSPAKLIHPAARAEEIGFQFAAISDHYHPRIDQQGRRPLAWVVLGGVPQQLRVGTAVTCPTFRYHPAIIAQAAATAACLMPGAVHAGPGVWLIVGCGDAVGRVLAGGLSLVP
ncbi:MAG: LLM class flavin-dependent oxidoreductase [Chloroflexota bacterium]